MPWPYCAIAVVTGKYLSEALIFASINPQFDNRLFIELPFKTTSAEHGRNMFYPYCGLVDARISAPEKDLPVLAR